ncbi:hypothetical protein E4K10_34435 [Streptomyces sp. T1317-0309]|nr:hypothetical protein E4K10_34435 [Streptomyces sp. T1317-0309]
MTRRQFGELIDELTAAPEVQRVRVLRTRRGHKRSAAAQTRAMDLLGQLFGVTVMTIGRANPESLPPSPDPI